MLHLALVASLVFTTKIIMVTHYIALQCFLKSELRRVLISFLNVEISSIDLDAMYGIIVSSNKGY